MNAVAESLTGWSQADALGQPLPDVFRIVHEDDARRRWKTRHSARCRPARLSAWRTTPFSSPRTGRRAPIDDSAAPIRDEAGATVGAVLVFRDVSERKRTDLARAHLAAIVESSDDAIVSKTLQSIICPGTTALSGCSDTRPMRRSAGRLPCSSRPNVGTRSADPDADRPR